MAIELEGAGDVVRLPKQDVNEGQKHSYLGEKEGLVETFERPEAGSSNAIPDLETQQRRVKAAKAALAEAERGLGEAEKGQTDGDAEKKKAGADENKGGRAKSKK